MSSLNNPPELTADDAENAGASEAEKRKKRQEEISRLNAAIAPVLKGLNPPRNITVSEWADENRVLSSESSAETGRYRTSRTPYCKEPMDAFTDPKVRMIVIVAPSQVGKSEIINNIIGYIIDEDPSSILFILPVNTDAKEYSKLRIAPMLRDTPCLRSKVAEQKSRDGSNTIMQKVYPGGILTLTGATEAHNLASKPIKVVLGDERDRWAVSAGKEGDPWLLAMARQKTFYNAKAVQVSTPTVKGASPIADAYAEGTQEKWCTKCPHCGEYHFIVFGDIKFDYETREVSRKKTYKVTSVWYACPNCGGASTENEIKNQPSMWIAENPEAYENGVRSFWINAWCSPWATWESIILEYLNARGDTRKLQVAYNTGFGELWEDRGDIQDEDTLMSKREIEPYGLEEGGTPIEIPEGVLVLTAGVDTQDDRFEYEVIGHGHYGETWGIEKGVVMGKPDDESTWAALDEAVIDRVFRFADGVGLRVSLTFVDEGGHFTQEVRQYCRNRYPKVFCIKGRGGPDIPYTSPPKKQSITIKKVKVGMCWQYQLGVDSGKQKIMDSLRVQEPGPKYCHFPKRDDYGDAYFTGLLSEHLVYKHDRKQPWVWEVIPGHERNEPLDCRNYGMAAFKVLPCNLDEADRRLKEARKAGTAPVIAAAPKKPKKRKPRRSAEDYAEDFFD